MHRSDFGGNGPSPFGELDLPVVMIDGIHFRDRVILVALGIDAQGNKHVLGPGTVRPVSPPPES